jgi:hypothetical protein
MSGEDIDRALCEAYGREPIETSGVENAIRREIGSSSKRNSSKLRWGIAAALVCAVALGGYWVIYPAPESKIFAAAALDHRIEVVRNAPRHWRTTEADLDSLTARFGVSRQQISFFGYRLIHAKICGLNGQRVLHLVYKNGATEYSLYLAPPSASVPVTETQQQSEHIASFHGRGIEGMVVTDGTAPDCRRFAKIASGI